jgi:3-dehydroquinate synthase
MRTYQVDIGALDLGKLLAGRNPDRVIAVVDANVIDLVAADLHRFRLQDAAVMLLQANEGTKELKSVAGIASELLDMGLTRHHTLLAVGGGITQDVVSFCASICLRGVDWAFVPTTLLAQADSCIGSKTSINLGSRKNAVGTFWPPVGVAIDIRFLGGLDDVSVRAGIGEMLKVHAIKGPTEFDSLAQRYPLLTADDDQMTRAIFDSLSYKKTIIEADERDSDVRLVMNYGHTFGHAIEVATDYAIPHGLAVTIGCDVANHVALELGLTSEFHFVRMHEILKRNVGHSRLMPMDFAKYEWALLADKKHGPTELVFILPDATGAISIVRLPRDLSVVRLSREYLETEYGA